MSQHIDRGLTVNILLAPRPSGAAESETSDILLCTVPIIFYLDPQCILPHTHTQAKQSFHFKSPTSILSTIYKSSIKSEMSDSLHHYPLKRLSSLRRQVLPAKTSIRPLNPSFRTIFLKCCITKADCINRNPSPPLHGQALYF